MVVIREAQKTELIVSLEDSEGEFLQCDPAYSDAPLRRARPAEDTRPIEDLRSRLEEADQVIAAAMAQDTEKSWIISELQDALHSKEAETPNPSCKHARWWTKVYGSGLRDVKIVYRAGRLNHVADALSRSPHDKAPTEGVAERELQVVSIQSEGQADTPKESEEISVLLEMPPSSIRNSDFATEQRRDPNLEQVINFLVAGNLPSEEKTARQIILQKSLFTIQQDILYYVDPRQAHGSHAESGCAKTSSGAVTTRTPLIADWRTLRGEEDLWSPGPTLVVGWDV